MKSVLKPLAKDVLLQFGLSAGMSTSDAAIQKEIYGSCAATVILCNKEMNDFMKIS